MSREYGIKYQPVGAARRLIPGLILGLVLDRVPPSKLVLYLLYLCTHF